MLEEWFLHLFTFCLLILLVLQSPGVGSYSHLLVDVSLGRYIGGSSYSCGSSNLEGEATKRVCPAQRSTTNWWQSSKTGKHGEWRMLFERNYGVDSTGDPINEMPSAARYIGMAFLVF